MEIIVNEKSEARRMVREIEKNLSDVYLLDSSRRITDKLLSLPEYMQAKSIFCYVGVGKEIDTKSILASVLANGKTLAVPRCLEKGIMEAYMISDFNDLEISPWGLLEPKTSCIQMSPDDIDLCIIPCLSCDKNGNRLGKGGGYYDRYLLRCQAPRICLCREKMLLDRVPTDKWDLPVGQVITEGNIYC